MKELGISKSQRLRTAREFQHVYEQRQRAGDDHLLIFGAANDLGVARFGLSVSRKQGNAVRRSRLKRLLREAFRLSQHELPQGLDLVLIPRQGLESTLEDYRKSITSGARRLSKRLRKETG